jgi:hypothetical protein
MFCCLSLIKPWLNIKCSWGNVRVGKKVIRQDQVVKWISQVFTLRTPLFVWPNT